jgi:hypothetical protein
MLSGWQNKKKFLLSTPREPTGKVNVLLLQFSASDLDEADRLTSPSGLFVREERTTRRTEKEAW